MPRALAIETSGRNGSVAVARGGRIIAEEFFAHHLQHAAGLLPLIDKLVRTAGWRPSEIEQVYVSIGPGSFTGLRIGVTAAKTIAFVAGAKLVAVPTSRALLANLPAEAREAMTVLDARRGKIITARYRRDSEVAPWREAESDHLDEMPAALARAARPVHLIGEGIPFHAAAHDSDGVIVTAEALWHTRASAVLALGGEAATAGGFTDPFLLAPLYVRRPEPEEKRLAAEAAKAGT